MRRKTFQKIENCLKSVFVVVVMISDSLEVKYQIQRH